MELAEFGTIADQIRQHARHAPTRIALIDGTRVLNYASLDALMDRVAGALQRDGLRVGDAVAICAGMSIAYAAVFLGALRAGVVVAPLAPGATPESLQRMLCDAQAKVLFTDSSCAQHFADVAGVGATMVALDGSAAAQALDEWMAAPALHPASAHITAQTPFNIIYSSGTTGEPKGIVQAHGMRWAQVLRARNWGYGPDAVAIASTPLYSNTTLVIFFPVLSYGGTVVLMPKFNPTEFLRLAQLHRASHAMLVPVQYQRLMACEDFDTFDLTSFQFKFSTSAPFSAGLKTDVISRWPGALIEIYGMTEGGGSCVLEAHKQPGKLHTVGQPVAGNDIRLINDAGVEVPAGETGEVVGHSPAMMTGYHGQPEKTREAEWFDLSGKRFIRTGDIGRFDEEGFLTLVDRKKDMIISGGFNVYPSDLEAVLRGHECVEDVAVVGIPSDLWGETPVAFVVRKPGADVPEEALLQWANGRLAKTQRLANLLFIAELPRSPIGKVLKRELRDQLVASRFDAN